VSNLQYDVTVEELKATVRKIRSGSQLRHHSSGGARLSGTARTRLVIDLNQKLGVSVAIERLVAPRADRGRHAVALLCRNLSLRHV
jgi:hypothetical protein